MTRVDLVAKTTATSIKYRLAGLIYLVTSACLVAFLVFEPFAPEAYQVPGRFGFAALLMFVAAIGNRLCLKYHALRCCMFISDGEKRIEDSVGSNMSLRTQ